MDLDGFKRIKVAGGGTVNDVVLAAVAGALADLCARGDVTADLELKAMVPISVRTTDEHGDLGNRVSVMYAPLPVGVEDPRSACARLSESMAT